MKPTKEHILDYLNELKHERHRDGIVQLGLFGSYACGENTLYSDIDIAIKKEENYLQHRNANTYFEEVAKIKRPSLVITEALSELPVEVSVGMELDGYVEEDSDDVIIYTVSEIEGDHATLDGNHPLSGMDLIFEGTVLDIHKAPPKECWSFTGIINLSTKWRSYHNE